MRNVLIQKPFELASTYQNSQFWSQQNCQNGYFYATRQKKLSGIINKK